MTATPFGGSTGLLHRLRPTRISAADLREVADALLPSLCDGDLLVRLVRRPAADSLVVIEEHGSRIQASLGELADDMTAAGVRPTSAAMATALSSWVAHRPVTAASAKAAGVAVLDWADRARTSVGWRVVVRRGLFTVPWTPAADDATLPRIRSAAAGRCHDVDLELHVEGPVALWSHAVAPTLATSVLVAPERMLERLRSAGLGVADMHVVVTPHRPVACAGPAVAARLAGESTEASVTLHWQELSALPWL